MRMHSRLQHGDRTLLRLRGAALKIRTISPNTALAMLTAAFHMLTQTVLTPSALVE